MGWSIYLVEGQLPSCAADGVPREYWNEMRRSRKFESDLEKAIALSLNETAPWISSNVFMFIFFYNFSSLVRRGRIDYNVSIAI